MRGTARPFLATTTVGGVVWLTPFNPTEVVAEIAGLLKSYRLTSCVRDHYAAGWVVEAFSKAGITYRHSDRNRSAIYSDALPLFASGRARLLDNPRLVGQFCGLERRTSPGGKDRIDHGPNGHDDLANAAAGALVGCAGRNRSTGLIEYCAQCAAEDAASLLAPSWPSRPSDYQPNWH